MSSSYSSKLRDARWQRKRLEVMERDKWTCRSCGAEGEGVTLNVHHAYYESGKDPWEYSADVLITWCDKCHEERHWIQNQILQNMMTKPIAAFRGILDLSINYTETLICISKLSCRVPWDEDLAAILKVAGSMYIHGMEDMRDSDGECLLMVSAQENKGGAK